MSPWPRFCDVIDELEAAPSPTGIENAIASLRFIRDVLEKRVENAGQ